MTTTLLRKALLDYLSSTVVTEKERDDINSTIVELDEIEQRAGTDDVWQHEVYILHADTVDYFMNDATYETYSKLYTELNGSVNYADYECAVLKYYPTITTAATEFGYEIVSSLYADNEHLAGLFTEDASTDWDKRMIKESREVMSMLEYCMNEPDADISISVKHKNGKSATANLYDHAALVQELYSALKYFIEEMQ